MDEDKERFVSRWSRLKRSREGGSPVEPGVATEASLTEAGGDAGASSEAEAEKIVESLPDIESLTEDSDFTIFLQRGVPQEIKQRALRRLWRLNPIFANLDGLNDYDDDFTDAALVVKNLKTLYEVGKGMPDLNEPEAMEEDADLAAQSAEASPTGKLENTENTTQNEQLTNSPAGKLTPADGEGAETESVASPAARETPSEAAPAPRAESGRAARRRWGDA